MILIRVRFKCRARAQERVRSVADGKAHPLKWQSGGITDGPSRAAARAMLFASGFSRDDLKQPLIGVANTLQLSRRRPHWTK